MRRVILVEGVSDVGAVETLAAARGQSLDHVAIVALGGATNVRNVVRELTDVEVAGLCDKAEERFFARVLDTYFVCDTDLEDELIRSLGLAEVERVIEQLGHLTAFHTFQRQPFQRTRTTHEQAHRFMGTMSGRKEQYARALATEVRVEPVPLRALLDWVSH